MKATCTYRVLDKFFRLGVNKEFKRANSQYMYADQIIKNVH